jgi:predicted nucleotidyltransferase component of viral defense system
MKFLTDNTYGLFRELAEKTLFSEFTFVGGSAIGYYLNHRLSEDLDFFTWHEKLPVETQSFIEALSKTKNIVIANRTNTYIDLFIDDIKVTLFANNWDALKTDRSKITGNMFVANLPLLCAMKMNTLSLRAKYRDYYDLYVLNIEKYTIKEMLAFTLDYIPGMTKKIFGMQLTYTEDIKDESIDHLSPKYTVTLENIKNHFEKEVAEIII